MKKIIYKVLTEISRGTEESPNIEQIFTSMVLVCNESNLKANEEIAKREAYNGKYEVVDDGQPDTIETPSQLDVLEAKVAYLAIMTDNTEIMEV